MMVGCWLMKREEGRGKREKEKERGGRQGEGVWAGDPASLLSVAQVTSSRFRASSSGTGYSAARSLGRHAPRYRVHLARAGGRLCRVMIT